MAGLAAGRMISAPTTFIPHFGDAVGAVINRPQRLMIAVYCNKPTCDHSHRSVFCFGNASQNKGFSLNKISKIEK